MKNLVKAVRLADRLEEMRHSARFLAGSKWPEEIKKYSALLTDIMTKNNIDSPLKVITFLNERKPLHELMVITLTGVAVEMLDPSPDPLNCPHAAENVKTKYISSMGTCSKCGAMVSKEKGVWILHKAHPFSNME